MVTDQFDNYQLDPNAIGDGWVFSGDQVHLNRSPKGKLSNWHYYVVDARRSNDYTRTTMGGPDGNINPQREVNDGWLGHGVDWSLFNYNPYGGRGDGLNVNFRVMNDWLQITGMGDITVVTNDVMDRKELTDGASETQYRNYPAEGYSSFGKTTGGASPDKRWTWSGNTWVPAS